MKYHRLLIGLIVLLLALPGNILFAQAPALATTFTYQGYLSNAGIPVTDLCDLQFGLFTASTGGSQIGSTLTRTSVKVTGGAFTVLLDFGNSAFDGTDRYVQVSVRCPAGGGSYTPLMPRQPLTPTPSSVFAARSTWTGLMGIPSGFSDNIDNDQLKVLNCLSGQIAKWDGNVWDCATDNGATYFAGTGLTLSSNNNVFSIITAFRLPTGCADGEIPKWAVSVWICGTDDTGTTGAGSFWNVNGNDSTFAGINFLGTTDNEPLEFRVNNQRALRLEPGISSPNIIGGYAGNLADVDVTGATIGGGGAVSGVNRVYENYGTIGGGGNNQTGNSQQATSGQYATIAGGNTNLASGSFSSIGGGRYNIASGQFATISGGGPSDSANPTSTNNLVTDDYGVVGGGGDNWAGNNNGSTGDAIYATVGGGLSNVATASYATIGGGVSNTASGTDASVGGGYTNIASGFASTVAGGYTNSATSSYATVPGGYNNIASQPYSFAAGYSARANHWGTFVWADSLGGILNSTADYQFMARASNGFIFYTSSNQGSGAILPAGGGAWLALSDRNSKNSLQPVDTQAVLQGVVDMPLTTWSYNSQDASIRHIGPMAQDFHAAFNVGEDEKHISTIDADGVALAAIQGLYKVVQDKDQQISDLQAENTRLQEQVDDLTTWKTDVEVRLTALEQGNEKPPVTESGLLNPLVIAAGLFAAASWRLRPNRKGHEA